VPRSRVSHPTMETLLDLLSNELSQTDRDHIKAHCLTCKTCSERLQSLRDELRATEELLHRDATRGWSFSTLNEVAGCQRGARKTGWRRLVLASASAAVAATTLSISLPRLLGSVGILRPMGTGTTSVISYLLLAVGALSAAGALLLLTWRKRR